eukprot:6168862-Pleurochrysis_carterae.AAC.1
MLVHAARLPKSEHAGARSALHPALVPHSSVGNSVSSARTAVARFERWRLRVEVDRSLELGILHQTLVHDRARKQVEGVNHVPER